MESVQIHNERKILSHIGKGSFLIKHFTFAQVAFGNSLCHVGRIVKPSERALFPHRLFSFMRLCVSVLLLIPLSLFAENGDDLRFGRENGRKTADNIRNENRSAQPLTQGEWFKIIVYETGIYRLGREFLASAGIGPEAFSDFESFRIFGNGGRPVPEDPAQPRPNGLQEVRRMIVDLNGNGMFDPEDSIVFFGKGASEWKYSAGSGFSHSLNPYTTHNVYFLTFGGAPGRGMDSVASLNNPSPSVVQDVAGMEFVEEEKVNLIHSGREWFGLPLTAEAPARTYSIPLPGVDATRPVNYRIAVLGRTSRTESFVISETGQTLGSPITILPVNLTSLETNYAYVPPVASFTRTGALSGNQSNLQVVFQTQNGIGWVNWIEIHYRRKLVAASDVLMFPIPDTSAVNQFTLEGFTSGQPFVFDVTDHDSVVKVVGGTSGTGTYTFQLAGTAGAPRMILAVGPSGLKTPAGITRVTPTGLREKTNGAEFIIITPPEFAAEAERLAEHRRTNDSLSVAVISLEAIMDEFGGGLTDPLAIRDFLAFAVLQWTTAPRYVLLFGDGHYDYRGITQSPPNRIPPYESAESVHQINSYASDDVLARVTAGNQRVSLALGRLPVSSREEASAVVDKIISYDLSAAPGPWRNRVTFVADDGLTSTGDDGSLHTMQADELSRLNTPNGIDKRKIYIVEYPTVNSSSGRRKPEANEAIVRAMNEGTLILNYTGHGNPQSWAHEAVFVGEESLPKLRNADRPFLLVAATCDFARYDFPGETSAGENMIAMREGGAIAVVTASRAVYSFENSQFNKALFTEFFRRDPDGRPPRIGDAFYRTKQIYFSLNDLKYHLLGDPTMRLNLPFDSGRIDSLNGNAVIAPVQLKALQKASVSGSVLRPDSTVWTEFAGTALLEVFDARRRIVVPEWSGFEFEGTGSLLYRGEVTVKDGRFRAIVPVPRDISYETTPARVAFYAAGPSGHVTGYTENVLVAGSDSSAARDTTGPQISVFLGDESFRSGDVVPPDPDLIVKLFDENGINTSTAGVGHRLEATFGSTGVSLTLNEYYKGDLDTFQRGEIRYPLSGLPEGRQLLTVTAWDTYNNAASEQVWFDVKGKSDIDVYNAFNVPNPFSGSTTFTFQRSSAGPIDVEIRIYTVSGRLVARLNVPAVTDRFVAVPWDGRDQNGDQIANGVYFYKIITRDLGRATSREIIGKLARVR